MIRMRFPALVLCALLAIPSGARSQPPAATGSSGYAKLRLTRVEAALLKDANATQFLAADLQGHLFLLRGDTLEVFRQGNGASFDRRMGKLACGRLADTAYAAAMDPRGWRWAVGSPDGLALCDFAKEQRSPGLDWEVSSVTFSRSGPLVAVAASGPTPDVATGQFQTKVPRVFGLEDDRWHPVIWAPVPELKDLPKDRMAAIAQIKANPLGAWTAVKARSDSLICAGPKDAIWLASSNSYRLQKVSVSGSLQPEREIVVGNGEVEWQKATAEERQHLARDLQAQGGHLIRGSALPRGVIRALLCGGDGVVYLVVATTDGLALDRFSPSQNVLERVLLDGVTVSSGPMTVALAADELWLGGRMAADGLWRISLEDLDAARWQPVKDVTIDGKPGLPRTAR
jgi:hypothetical protein